MEDYIAQNKEAWEYNAYEFWIREAGTPAKRAEKILQNPGGKNMRLILILIRESELRTSAAPVEKKRFR